MRVLVVEDNSLTLKSMETILRSAGADVVATGDGSGAMTHLSLGAFDALVVDLRMPGLDGLGLLAWLRDRGDRTSVVVTTAAAEDLLDEARTARSDLGERLAMLRKPFEPEELLAAIRQVTGGDGPPCPTP